jgi:tRNA pseudouridine55 synthase
VGEATKIASFIEAHDKRYRTVALLGTETDTQDVTGTTLAQKPVDAVTEHRIREVARRFIGRIEQTPPAFSAVKVNGVRAYKLARRREKITLKPRNVEIRRFEIENIRLPRVALLIECSKGTYIRTLCSDLGTALGVGGCMESLRRLGIGRFSVDDARAPAELRSREDVLGALIPASAGLSHLPAIPCSAEQVTKLAHGMTLDVGEQIQADADKPTWAQALEPGGELVAVGKIARDRDTILFHPKRVLKGPGNP